MSVAPHKEHYGTFVGTTLPLSATELVMILSLKGPLEDAVRNSPSLSAHLFYQRLSLAATHIHSKWPVIRQRLVDIFYIASTSEY